MQEVKIKTLKQAEIIINRLVRKSPKVVVGLAPASVIYQYTDRPGPEGHVFRLLFPVAGRIARVLLHIPIATKEKMVPLHVELMGSKGQYVEAKAFRMQTQVDVDYTVEEGDRLVVLTDPNVPSSFEVSILFYPRVESGEKIKTKIEALEAAADEGIHTSE